MFEALTPSPSEDKIHSCNVLRNELPQNYIYIVRVMRIIHIRSCVRGALKSSRPGQKTSLPPRSEVGRAEKFSTPR